MPSQIAYNGTAKVFTSVLGMGPRRTEVTLTETELRVRMGWAFAVVISREDITAVALVNDAPWYWGIGAHLIGSHRWIVNGTLKGLVEVSMVKPVRGRALGVPIKVASLLVSVSDPKALKADLSAKIS